VPSAGCPRCARLQEATAALQRQLQHRDAQIAALRERLEQAERAGKRQAAPFSKGEPTAQPKRPGRKPGASYGTKARRPIPDHVDESYEAPLGPRCPYCNSDAVNEDKVVEIYEEDIPPVRPRVRRFRVHVGRCRHCRRRLQGRHPLQTSTAIGAANVHVGPHVLALGAELQKRLGTPYGKLARILQLAFALSVTPGGLCLALRRVAAALAPTYAALIQRVRQAPVVVADETGWKVAGRLQWLKHLRTERDAVFTFLRHPAVEATNWPAEQAIRPAVITRKICGGNRTPRGATIQSVLASVLQTCHQQGADPSPVLADLLRSPAPYVAPLPALLAGP
jgi:transposase